MQGGCLVYGGECTCCAATGAHAMGGERWVARGVSDLTLEGCTCKKGCNAVGCDIKASGVCEAMCEGVCERGRLHRLNGVKNVPRTRTRTSPAAAMNASPGKLSFTINPALAAPLDPLLVPPSQPLSRPPLIFRSAPCRVRWQATLWVKAWCSERMGLVCGHSVRKCMQCAAPCASLREAESRSIPSIVTPLRKDKS